MKRIILIRKWSTSSPEVPHAAVMGFHGVAREQIVSVEMPVNWPMSRLLEGFWTNKDTNKICDPYGRPYGKEDYWVPPSQILSVEASE